MRTQICRVETREEAADACPWAAKIVEVEGGWMCFESIADFDTWAAQV